MLFFWAANPGQFYLYMINHSVILERVKRDSTNKVVDRLAKPISESPITLAIQISLTNRIISFFHKKLHVGIEKGHYEKCKPHLLRLFNGLLTTPSSD